MALACSFFAIGIAALVVMLLRRLISPTRFAQAAGGLALGAGLVAAFAMGLEAGHG